MTFKKGYIEVCLTTEDGIQHLRCHGWLKRQQILVKSEQVFRKGSEDFGMFIIVIPSEELYEIMDLKDDMFSSFEVMSKEEERWSSYKKKKDKEQTLQGEIFVRALNILKQENIEFDKRAVVSLVQKYFPDWRRVLNELQRYSVSGKIDAGVLVNITSDNMEQLISFMKNKEFTNVREWVVNNLDNDPTRLFRSLYDSLYDNVDGSSIPHIVVILAEYQYKASFVADQEINSLACLTEIMARAKFK